MKVLKNSETGPASSVTILGTRGSVPVSGEEYRRYGCGTTCILVRLAGQPVLLDAGTGILNVMPCLAPEERELPLLLSHAHMDHVSGLPLCPLTFRPEVRLNVFGRTRNGLTIREQLERLMSPPLWPVGPEILPADIRFHELPEQFMLGPVRVETMEGIHPGGVSLFRLTGGTGGEERSVVMMTDCTLEASERARARFLRFAQSCDLLLCDGQYSPEEWESRSGFGHSTWEQVARFGRDCGAKRIRIIHHDPFHTDEELDEAEEQIAKLYPRCGFARAGEELTV